ncbi:MAG TPA: SMP-30/gluconolactonase/LRE family protein [Chitinophagaceae bacterium]|nr:SMP-30/gluconolactonase/LRE family protein [Chitinophagaceae bacterium]
MTKSIFLFLSFAGLISATSAQTIPMSDRMSIKSTSNIIADNTTLQLISSQFNFTEGPATDKKGNVYFTDQPNNKIWKYSTDGKLSVFLENAGRSNGMYFDRKGNLVTCADEHNQLWSVKPNGKVKVLLKDVNGDHLNGPNDLWIHPGGGIYFTDPYYQRSYWTRTSPEIEGEKVYYLQKNKSAVVVAGNLIKPNGIIGTADGKDLYVADIKGNKTYRYSIAPDGTLKDQTVFVNQGSDGMTIDELGNIYLTGKGVTVYNKEGKLIEHIDVPEPWTANVTFGGKEKNILFITASKAVYILKMKVKGV